MYDATMGRVFILRWLPYVLLVTSAVFLMLYFDASSIILAAFQTSILGGKNNISTPHYASAIFGGARNVSYAERGKYQQMTDINQANTRDGPLPNPEAMWRDIKPKDDGVSLYPAEFDVERIRDALRNDKLLSVSKLRGDTTFKLNLILEGKQKVLFKPRIRDRHLETCTNPRKGCEYPEYEVTAFAINRLLDLRSTPFVTGRRFNWFKDILPVAKHLLIEAANITQDGDVCFRHQVSCKSSRFFCFPQGNIIGSAMIWLDTPVLYLRPSLSRQSLYNPLTGLDSFKSLPLGDDTFCKWFRTTHEDYHLDRRFVNILDIAVLDYMMLSYESRDNYIINKKNEQVNVFIDRGKSFRHSDNDTFLLAPIYQCCKIRAKVYKSLLILKDNFIEAFINETQTDEFHPILDNEELAAIQSRIHDILKYVDACIKMFSLRDVMLDV